MNLELRDLQLVSAVVEQGGLSAAAGRLGLTQPALSRQLADAERRLGSPLFVRQGRRLRLAAAGARVLALAQTVLPEFELAEREIRNPGPPQDEPEVRVSPISSHAYLWLLTAVRAHAEKHANASLRVEVPGDTDAFELLQSERTDLVISPGPGIRPELKAIPLFREELFAYVSPKHPAARQTFFPLADFGSMDLVVDVPLFELPVLAHALRAQGIKPKRVIRVPLTEAVLELAAQGFGVACLTRRETVGSPRKRLLTELKITARGLFVGWRALCLRSRAGLLTPKAQELAAAIAG